MKLKLISTVAACALALGAQTVFAVPTTYSLNDPNAALSGYTGPFGSVSVDLTDSTHATITFTGSSGGGFVFLFGANGMADVNVNASSFNVNVSSPGTAQAPSPVNNLSTFGNFNVSIDNQGGAGNAVNSVVFTVQNVSGTWAGSGSVLVANSDGYLAAAHIIVKLPTGGDAVVTGYAGNGTTTHTAPDGGTTAILMGMGLIGLVWMRRAAFAKN